ncbi:MAG TPA: DNA-binding protein [Clostridiales bacterium]|nr:DNA-binding protein [Clostridiales bacterium]
MALTRMRTISGCMEYLRQEDPESCITEYYLRGLVKQNKVPVFHAGRKQLVNLDKLLEYLSGDQEVKEPEQVNYGKLRRVGE